PPWSLISPVACAPWHHSSSLPQPWRRSHIWSKTFRPENGRFRRILSFGLTPAPRPTSAHWTVLGIHSFGRRTEPRPERSRFRHSGFSWRVRHSEAHSWPWRLISAPPFFSSRPPIQRCGVTTARRQET